MNYFQLYVPLLFITFCIAVVQWKKLSKADRWICLLLIISFIQECVARYYHVKYRNNFPTFHVYTPIELSIIIIYFNSSIGFIKHRYFELSTFAICGILGFLNTRYIQSLYQFNSYYLLFEGCVVIGLCMLSFYRLLIREDIVPGRMAHFWFIICFLFYWSLTYANFGLYGAQLNSETIVATIFNFTIQAANFLFYIGIATIFLRYKKLIPSGE